MSEKVRYQVLFFGEVYGEFGTLDEALEDAPCEPGDSFAIQKVIGKCEVYHTADDGTLQKGRYE